MTRHDLIPDEQDRAPTEGEVRATAASNRIQAVFRGHRERRAALFTPLWVPYPSPLRALQWGYEARSSVAELQREFDYREQLELLNDVLSEGLSALPHNLAHSKARPVAARKPRGAHLCSLVVFCLDLAGAYVREGYTTPAAFLWESVTRMLSLPPAPDATSASHAPDACLFRGRKAMLAAALDGLAFSKWKGGDVRGAEALLDQALALCVPGLLFFFITPKPRVE